VVGRCGSCFGKSNEPWSTSLKDIFYANGEALLFQFDTAGQKMEYTTMMNGMGMPGMMLWGLIMFVFGLIVLFLFILAAAYGVKWVWRQQPSSTNGRGESASDLLKKRYAKGEISREEFERIKKEIE
jgi:putative membrane protein